MKYGRTSEIQRIESKSTQAGVQIQHFSVQSMYMSRKWYCATLYRWVPCKPKIIQSGVWQVSSSVLHLFLGPSNSSLYRTLFIFSRFTWVFSVVFRSSSPRITKQSNTKTAGFNLPLSREHRSGIPASWHRFSVQTISLFQSTRGSCMRNEHRLSTKTKKLSSGFLHSRLSCVFVKISYNYFVKKAL